MITLRHQQERLARILVTVACTFFLASCGDEKQASSGNAAPPSSVGIVTVAPETVRLTVDLPGRINPTRIAEVRPRVAGIVIERVFKQGTTVKQGDVLYRIDPAPFRARVDSAKAALQRAAATRLLARQQADRQIHLKEKDVTTGQAYDRAIAELAQAEADEASAKAGLETATLDLQYTEVRAPISGRIGRALITEGALVSLGGTDSLATIQQLEPVYADFTQSANELLALKRSAQAISEQADAATEVRMRFDDGSSYAHSGRLLFSEAAVDTTTGQITLRGEFPNPEGDLLPGMYVRIQIQQGERNSALMVPERALQRDSSGQAQLYTVNAEQKVEIRSVEPEALVEGRWLIKSGLKAGDRVIAEGFQLLAAGAPVDPKPWSATSNAANTAAK